jgi:hypothetical protein
MTGIIAAVEPGYDIRLRGEQIDEFALSFIPPLETHNRCDGHVIPPE